MINAPLDVESLSAAVHAGESFTYRYFWGHRARGDGALSESCFSQWWPCRFVVDGQEYRSAEQFMMASKARLFVDQDSVEAILASTDPKEIKALGRKVAGFDERRWAEARLDLVTMGNVAKFGQDPSLRQFLLATGDDVLVEASPVDPVWGIGLAQSDARAADPREWRGLNLLGFALMRARAILKEELPAPTL